MSDRDRDKQGLDPLHKLEPEPGKGTRSLAQWQNLAKVRQSLAASNDAREQYRLDPAGYMSRHGLDMPGAPPAAAAEGGLRLGIEPASESAEMQLAFCKVWGCVIVVAGAVGNGVAVANAVAMANLTANVNSIGTGPPSDNPTDGGSFGTGTDDEPSDGGTASDTE